MYNTNIICSYNTDSIFLTTDLISDDDKFFVRNVVYRQEMLDIFGLEENDNLYGEFHKLYEILKCNNELKKCMNEFAKSIMSTDEESGLIIMYSYDYMSESHKCISEFLETGVVTEINMANLMNKIV